MRRPSAPPDFPRAEDPPSRRSAVAIPNDRLTSIVLKNLDFRFDHNCRGRTGATRSFSSGLGPQQQLPAGEVRSAGIGSFKFERAPAQEEAAFCSGRRGQFNASPESTRAVR